MPPNVSSPTCWACGAPRYDRTPVTDAELARALARDAGVLLVDLRASSGLSGDALGDAGDRAANRLILERLAAERPDDRVLSEEAADDRVRCDHARVWIVDPLDGTREYREGRDDWAVHIGLAIAGRPVAGAVALPAMDRVLDSGSVAPPSARTDGRLRIVISRSRAPELCRDVADRIGADLVPMGSAGAKAMAVVDGRADAYLHTGGQYEWDNCAPVAVARAAGLHASRVDGSDLIYNCVDPLLPDLLVCRPELAATLLSAVRACG